MNLPISYARAHEHRVLPSPFSVHAGAAGARSRTQHQAAKREDRGPARCWGRACTEVTHYSQAALVRLEKAQISLLTGVEQHLCDLQLPSAGNCAVPEPDGQCFTAGHVSLAGTEAEHPWDQDLQQPSASHTSPSNVMHKSHLISRDFVARCVCGKLILVQQSTEGQAGFKHGSKL